MFSEIFGRCDFTDLRHGDGLFQSGVETEDSYSREKVKMPPVYSEYCRRDKKYVEELKRTSCLGMKSP